ncbi:Gfo/Idh/MocA family protein [Haloferula rosea]|uniref:Gfo/Idh/MocA family oxidoreductase n=1 Tax=Haloferula rosea TaxID=490093 RepID=A0A934RIH2_9BACT|nr:Gfo/Idh/MocA family oxidoreductase [Haloferula rosea]MBK1828885.1 Gfo/Idh/MocA family oxidoreductase [Haloferula rosea]
MKELISPFGRRRFIQTLGATALSTFPSLGAVGANEQVRLGVIGCGGRGTSLMKQFHGLKNVRVVALSDPDTAQMGKAAKVLKGGSVPEQFQDYRKLLESKDIDAVIVASPNHWHALHTIHACQAGKDVYVEKPVTHKMNEASKMVEAAEKYDRIVQAGTQNRSDTGLIKAFDFIQSGEIGKITAIRGLCYRNRDSIGRAKNPPLKPPTTCDYDLWLGPAQDLPILRKQFHYDWHWIWNTGNGDVGNQAPHEFDIMAWALGDPAMPSKVQSFGQRFGWDDGGQTPNMQVSWFELGGVPAIFEVNDMKIKPGTNASPAFKGTRVGIIVTCEGGEFRGGRGGGYIVGPDGKERLHKFPGDAGGGHAQNFVDAIRSRKADTLRGKLSRSTDTAALSHLSNISYRSGKPATSTELRNGMLADSPALLEVLDRQESQLKAWGIDTNKVPYMAGTEVSVDPATRKVIGDLANSEFAVPAHRKGYTLPEKV